jgi:cytochrome c oxidase subunit 2
VRIRLPAAIFLVGAAALAALTVWSLGGLPGSRPAPVRVTVIGHSWWWEFVYPDLGFRTANEMHVPAGSEIRMELISVDVLHTFSVPELALEAAALAGQTNSVSVRAPEAGELGGECSEICGTAHNMMRVKVVVDSPADFEAWAAHQKQPAAVPQTEQQWAGYEFVTTACARCHSLDPAEARTDLLGPNLAHLMSRSVFAGASFNLNETNLRRWLRDTQAMKAGNDMVINLPRDDYAAIVEYLLLLK